MAAMAEKRAEQWSFSVATRYLVAQPRCLTLFSFNGQEIASTTTSPFCTPLAETYLPLDICSMSVGAGLWLIVASGLEWTYRSSE